VHIVLYIIEIVVALGLIIFVHELGHFLSAKAFGVRARKFALGMGPVIVKWGKGETEYSIRWIPLGGFVDLVGEHPEADEADDPRGLWRRPAWQKIIVFAAGVFMNAVLALVLFAVAPMVGVQAPMPVIGDVLPGTPAKVAGLEPGDRILSIDGRRIASFDEFQFTVALADAGTNFKLEVARPVPGSETPKILTFDVASMRSKQFPVIGVQAESEPVIYRMFVESAVAEAGLKIGDRVLAVNGQPVDSWHELEEAVKKAPPRQLTLTVQRGEQTLALPVNFANVKIYDPGFAPPTAIHVVQGKTPAAEAGLKPDDLLVSFQGIPWPSDAEFLEAVQRVPPGEVVHLQVQRGDQVIDVAATLAVLPGAGFPRLGAEVGPALDAPVRVGSVTADGPAWRAGLRPGDIIVKAGSAGKEVATWKELAEAMGKNEGEWFPLTVHRGESQLDIKIPLDYLTLSGAVPQPKYFELPRLYSPIEAAQRGVRQTGLWFARVYINIKQLFTGEVSTETAAGPVGIVQVSYMIASHGLGAFLDFMGILTVSIAVLNFLPIPPFDGGHALFVIIEKIMRRPVGLKTRTAFWIVGWGLVLALFLVVTYRDIVRVVTQWITG
jgi:regulator of sigma E protease